MTTLQIAKDLAREHDRLARELYREATSARRDSNFHVGDCLAEQADLHTTTYVTIYDLLDEISNLTVREV